MERLKNALEALDESIFELEHKIGLEKGASLDAAKKQSEALKQVRAREVGFVAVTQKVAARLDQAINHVEHILRH